MSPSDPQSRRNGQRSGMPLTDQFRADLVIELRILLQFPLAEKLQCIPAAHPALDHISRRFIYVTGIALDAEDQIIGYQFVNLGKMTDFIKKGDDPTTAYEKQRSVRPRSRCSEDH